MASKVLYPPIVNSYMPAFVAKEGAICRVYFSLSKFNASSDFKTVHVAITKQGSGVSVVNKIDSESHYRLTGIVLNVEPVNAGSNSYYIDIISEDIKEWTVGWIYKIQIRLSAVNYDETISQPAWLNANANNFSEWSTVCTIKAIGENQITIPNFNYNSIEEVQEDIILSTSTLDITGSYSNQDKTENLYSYKIKLLKDNNILEESDILYPNQYINANQFNYLFKQELDDGDYTFILEYETNNKYIGVENINFSIFNTILESPPFDLLSAEVGADSTVYAEEEEGRIGLQILKTSTENYIGKLCIRRTDEFSNFQKWEDIKIISYDDSNTEEHFPIIYDYTAISGIKYRYGIQSINEEGNRSHLNIIGKINDDGEFNAIDIKREYQFSYLLGEGEQQLKLKFDNTLSNFKIMVSDSKADTIGGKYPFITRNGNMYYKTFSFNGLISYNMDDAHMFLNQKDKTNNLYDYTYERLFRDEVFNFLFSGKPKLFKSPTEGNILVRLMDINATPNKSLNRMIYNFSANAIEIDNADLKTCIDNKLISLNVNI